jgi:hypothetical protein
MADPILQPVSSLVTAAIDAMVASRPSTLPHFNNPDSRWNDLPALWRAQALLVQRRLVSEVKAARLATAGDVSFDALRSLCSSEFNTTLPTSPQVARATVALHRNVTGVRGAIPAGTPFNQQANPNAVPLPIGAAAYTVDRTVYMNPSDTGCILQLTATSSGTNANAPTIIQYQTKSIQPSVPLFDPNLAVSAISAAGGSSGLPNAVLIAAATAYAAGQFGPTLQAAVAGVLQQQSVRHFAVFPGAAALPYLQLYIADESWSDDPTWHSAVLQTLQDASAPWIGFGCRVRMGTVINQQIAVAATIVLASTDDLANTNDIDANVRAVAESYFNDRTDWYLFRSQELQAVLSAADPRILQCTSVSVTDAVDGSDIDDPSFVFGVAPFQPVITHWLLVDQNCQATYSPPM